MPPAPHQTCDRPALLPNGGDSDGQCVPYSRILSLSTKTIQVAVMCRQKKIRAADQLEFDEIDVVSHNPATGATCWFQASPRNGQPIDGAHISSPTAESVSPIWNDPEKTARDGCGTCHDAGPVMYSPFVGQVWQVMPVDPFGPYFHVDPGLFGFDRWPTVALTPRDNTSSAAIVSASARRVASLPDG